MKVKLGEIVNAVPALNKAAEQALPVRTSYQLARLVRKISKEVGTYDAERIKLCKRFGKLDEEKQAYNIPPESLRGFEREMNELLAQEVEISADPISVTDELRLSAAEVMTVEKFLNFNFKEE